MASGVIFMIKFYLYIDSDNVYSDLQQVLQLYKLLFAVS